MNLRKFLKLWVPQAPETWGAVGTPNFFFYFTAAEGGGKWALFAPETWGALGAPNIFILSLLPPPKAAANGSPKHSAIPLEGEGNPAEGGYFASINIYG